MVAATSNNSATHSIAELITEFHKTTGHVPPPLIGATTTLVNGHVYLFGGRLQSTRQISNRVHVLSLQTKRWKILQPQSTAPPPRYFHSAEVYHNTHILYYGGMGAKKNKKGIEELATLNDLVFLNIQTMSWEYPNLAEHTLPSPRYAHTSALSKDKLIIMGGQDIDNQYLQDIHIFDIKKRTWCTTLSSRQHQYGAYRSAAVAVTPIELAPHFAPTMDLLSDAYEETQTTAEDISSDINIHVYSNFGGADVVRNLHAWKINPQQETIELQDQSDSINSGNTLPPPLRFPSAFMCGQQFILAGPHLSATAQQFQIWAMDTNTFVWTKIEAGYALSRGAWLKGLLSEDTNQFIVFGNPERSMQIDYKDRVHCFEHIACVDIEIFGIYRPPRSTYSGYGQGLGLALLKDPILADLNIVTIDQQHIAVNSTVLAQRWPTIRPLLKTILDPQIEYESIMDFDKRELHFPDTYVVLVAFLQFIYTDHLVTAQQHQPQILARLLFIADLFKIPRLKALATHALHQMLNIQTATMIYESASLSNAVSLQIRALRVMINAKKMMQRQKRLEQSQREQQQIAIQPTQRHQFEIATETPFSPPPTPASTGSSSMFSSSTSSHQSSNTSRFLQKYDLSRQQQHQQQQKVPQSVHQQSLPNTPISTSLSRSLSSHQRSSSQRSLSTESNSAPATPSVGKQSIKLPNFRIRQASAPLHSDGEHSPQQSPKVTPSSTQSKPSPTRSATSFWRQTTTSLSNSSSNSSLNASLKKKSESSNRMPTFNFIK